jgi:tripartite ATP-independent transporter DctP family solute receptor
MRLGGGQAEGRGRAGDAPSRRAVLAGAGALGASLVLPRAARAAGRLRLAHGLPQAHPVHRAMANLADLVKQRSRGGLTIEIFADGLLGEEPMLLEQVRAGTLDMTKASASVLDGVNPLYRVFDIPFLFRDKGHWRRAVGGPVGQRLLAGGPEAAMTGLCFYDAGARSFYGRRPVIEPGDLAGQKIRIQPSPTMARMVRTLGAEPVPLPWGVVYTALKTGLVDGAENNVTALTYGRHAEVARHYTFTEHTMVPDVLLIGARALAGLSPAHREILAVAAADSALLQGELWAEAEQASRRAAEALDVAFHTPDKAPFAAALRPLREEYLARGDLASLIAAVERA